MTWEQIKRWLLERIEELPWYRRWAARAALWALERDLNPQALGLGIVVLAIIVGLLIALLVAMCRTG
jgi:hypothetical protein